MVAMESQDDLPLRNATVKVDALRQALSTGYVALDEVYVTIGSLAEIIGTSQLLLRSLVEVEVFKLGEHYHQAPGETRGRWIYFNVAKSVEAYDRFRINQNKESTL